MNTDSKEFEEILHLLLKTPKRKCKVLTEFRNYFLNIFSNRENREAYFDQVMDFMVKNNYIFLMIGQSHLIDIDKHKINTVLRKKKISKILE